MQSGEDSHVFPLFYFSYHNSGCCYEVRAVKHFKTKARFRRAFVSLLLQN